MKEAMNKTTATVVGAGLAGSEAAYQLAERGIFVKLYEMKPHVYSPAHKSESFAELVCSNSLRSDRLENAVGLLKEELRRMGSLIMAAADAMRVPAGGALAVDREGFSRFVTEKIRDHPRIHVLHEEVKGIPAPPAIIASGPLTGGALYDAIEQTFGSAMHFFDAAAPVIYRDSVDMETAFYASRYGRGEDYINCPMTALEYDAFYNALISAETAPLHDFETPRVFEGCMPIETMAKRGEKTLLFGPLKPVGLQDVRKGNKRFHAVVQLRQDDARGTLYNLVGFQTNLTFSEQKRVFRMIPGLQNAEFARLGVMHRNSFLQSPGFLDQTYQVKSVPGLYFAGQITGVEGYVESASSGYYAALSLARQQKGLVPPDFTDQTAIGALGRYVSSYRGSDFQPMNINYGILAALPNAPRNKQQRYLGIAERALKRIEELKE